MRFPNRTGLECLINSKVHHNNKPNTIDPETEGVAQIAQKLGPVWFLGAFYRKNRVWISVDAGLWCFCLLFSPQKSGVQFVFGFGRAEPRSHWIQKGRGLDVPSRLKGIETSCL